MTVTPRNKAATSSEPTARTTYRHGDLHRALLDAGIELARQGGPDAVVLREATRRAGVAPNAAYRHFANRDDLLGAVRAAAVAAAARSMETELTQVPTTGTPTEQAHAKVRRRRPPAVCARRDRALFAPPSVAASRCSKTQTPPWAAPQDLNPSST